MVLSFVVAASENNVIGKGNTLPWHLPEDLKFFKKTTFGKPVVMGRKTMESLGKPLPGRVNIVLSRNMEYVPGDKALVVPGISEALDYLKQEGVREAFIIGGGGVFESTLDLVDIIYLTRVHTHITDGDTFFPEVRNGNWELSWEEPHFKDQKHAFDYTFQKWERKKA